MLEFGDQYIRFFRNNGAVETSPGVPYEVVSDYYSTDVMDLQFVQSADVLYIFIQSTNQRCSQEQHIQVGR